jgi:hypothetical protein
MGLSGGIKLQLALLGVRPLAKFQVRPAIASDQGVERNRTIARC